MAREYRVWLLRVINSYFQRVWLLRVINSYFQRVWLLRVVNSYFIEISTELNFCEFSISRRVSGSSATCVNLPFVFSNSAWYVSCIGKI